MSVEHKERAYQRFLPGAFKEAWGVKEPAVVGINLQRSQEPIENLEFPPETSSKFRTRLSRKLRRIGVQTLGQLPFLDLEHLPGGFGQKSIGVIQTTGEEIFLREKESSKPPPLEVSLPQDLEAVLENMIRAGIFSSALRGSIKATEERIKEMPESFNIDLDSFFAYIYGPGYPLNLEDQEKDEKLPLPEEASPYVVRILYQPGIGHNILVTWGDPIYDEVAAYYQRQQRRLQEKAGGFGVKEKLEYILPFVWFWSDFYYYRGLWFWQGRPDEDQFDAIALSDPGWWEHLPSALIFCLGASPLIKEKAEEKMALVKEEAPLEEKRGSLRSLGLSFRTYAALRRAGIHNLESLHAWDWKRPPSRIGKKSLQEIEEALGRPLRPEEEKPLSLSQEDLPEEVKKILNLPEAPFALPISVSQMSQLTGLPRETLLAWAKERIIGKQVREREYGRWQFNKVDLLIAAAILKRGKWTPLEEKRAISEAIRSGQPLEKPPQEQGKQSITIKRLIRLQEALKKAEFPKPLLGLREATTFLKKINSDNYPSNATLEEFIKTAIILGNFPLSPEAVRVTRGNKWQYAFTKKDLLTIFDVALEVLKTRNFSLEEAFRKAKETFREERARRVPLEALFTPIFERLGYVGGEWAKKKREARKIIIENLQQGKLPLRYDITPQRVLVLGVLPEDQEDFIVLWTDFLKKEKPEPEKPAPTHILRSWSPLTGFLREHFGKDFKINPRFIIYAVAWLESQGISVTTITRRQPSHLVSYHRLSPETQEQLDSFLGFSENKKRLEKILRKGFTLEEVETYQQYFPPDFHLSVAELCHLATGKSQLREYKKVIQTLVDGNISVREEKSSKGSSLHKVPLSEIQRAVNLLKEENQG